LLSAIKLNENHFAPIVFAAHHSNIVEEYKAKQDAQYSVVAVAGHTLLRLYGNAAANKHFAYLSSGTWSLMNRIEQPVLTITHCPQFH
jgi:hypothetical protein